MQRIERCEVKARKRNLYYIVLSKNEACEGCKACAFGKKNYLVVPSLSEIDCEAGDRVEAAMPQSRVKGSYVYLYLLPLLFAFAGLMIPLRYGEMWMLLGGAIGLALSVPAVYLIERLYRRRKKFLPVILRKISDKGEETND